MNSNDIFQYILHCEKEMKVSLFSPKKAMTEGIAFLGESTDSVLKLAHNFQVSIHVHPCHPLH